MNCENALELMNRELDEALTESESAALRTHLDACPDCRETWRQLHELDALLRDGELEPPAALHDGVMQAIRQEQKKPRRAWVPAAAIAAAAALVLLAGRAGLIALPGFEQTDVISVNIGPAVELIHFMVSSVLHRKCGFSCACSMRICARLSARWFSNSACWLCRRATTMVLNCCANSPNSSCRPAGTGTCTSRLFFPTCRLA